ncbi:hypothetical protein GTY81_19315 [Streptomyces sp. SID8366]|uniref:hypothetical protein n=1 Tax=unclassified Streptomyces TaxID=2593676 RepID=UPI000DB9689E|nr:MULTISPECIES: hypothetical protein [unclassified Streptomyces]MYU05993.1 hypothetical protein [Streptomyces sp. SID8366]MYU64360.1 hypothetical protein [Streptomyces sp. SID69]RAJ64052.1 hypothetical protein K376_01148 [Streptomyces sp. PsTaAH-130]
MSAHRVPRPLRARKLRTVLGVSALGAALAVTGTVAAQAAQSDHHAAGHSGTAATPKPVPSVPSRTATPTPVPSVPGGTATPRPVPSVPGGTATPSPVPAPPRSASPSPVPSTPAHPHHGPAVPAPVPPQH